MICPQCKMENPNGSKFCSHCGAKLSPQYSNNIPNSYYYNHKQKNSKGRNSKTFIQGLSFFSSIVFILSIFCFVIIISCKYLYLEKVECERSSRDYEYTEEVVTIYPFFGDYSPLTRGRVHAYNFNPSERNVVISKLHTKAYYEYQNSINELISDMFWINFLVLIFYLSIHYLNKRHI